MKVVLLHDWLTGFRGGERVLEVFAQMFPQAPLYTLFYRPGSTSPAIENRKIVASWANQLPGAQQHYRKLLPFMPHLARSLRIQEKADLVLSSSHCVIKAVRPPPGARHLSYIHSPMRYMYDRFEDYFAPGQAPLWQRQAAQWLRPSLQRFDRKSNEKIDKMIANSHFVAERIQRFYGRQAAVVHPFVDLDDIQQYLNPAAKKQDYCVVLSAFAPNKKVGLAIDAFNQLKRPLMVIGSGQQEEELRAKAGPQITFLGSLPRKEVIQTLQKAQALIFPGVEDFGIVPLESLACGTPVVAYRRGGVLETLDEQTAQFFDEQSSESLIGAVKNLKSFDREQLQKKAQAFSRPAFKEKIHYHINQLMDLGPHETRT